MTAFPSSHASRPAYAGPPFHFSPATRSEFSLLTPDNATGHFTKVAQRLPVRIAIDPNRALAEKLAPGMSVAVSLDTAAPAEVRTAEN